eukprot:3286479-Pyramimonas_sp.AAC.1
MRNLGHDLSGPKARRVIEKKLLAGLVARKPKLRALVRGANHKARTLWRTGLLPAAAHGAGVGGITDATLNSLRSIAAVLAGARQHVSITAWLATQAD